MEETITMTKAEFEKEIQMRIDFKFSEIESILKNKIEFKFAKAWMDMSKESKLEHEVFKEINEMFAKEARMGMPWQDFKVLEEKRRKKNKAVDNIMSFIEPKLLGRVDTRGIPQKLANEIESAQL